MTDRIHEAATAASRKIAERKAAENIAEKKDRAEKQLQKIMKVRRDRVEMSKKAKELYERNRLKRKKA